MIEAVREAHLIEQLLRAMLYVGLVGPHHRRYQDVFEHGALGQQAMILKHKADFFVAERRGVLVGKCVRIAAIELDFARSRRLQRAQDVEQRALSGAGRADDGDRVARLEGKRHAAQNRQWPSRRRV